jgi:hypothetical protein
MQLGTAEVCHHTYFISVSDIDKSHTGLTAFFCRGGEEKLSDGDDSLVGCFAV